MLNELIFIKIKERVNKNDSSDYPNIQPYQFIETFNKAQDNWVRRVIQGLNQTKTTAEGSIRRIDDLQILLTEWTDTWTKYGLYYESTTFPIDYLDWCRLTAYAQDECKDCPPRRLVIFLGNEADVDLYLADDTRRPDYQWATTFSTISRNRFKIWTNGEFNVVDPKVLYYRNPIHIQVAGELNPDDGLTSTANVLCEFPDSVIELLCDEAASILSGDWENYNRMQTLLTTEQRDT